VTLADVAHLSNVSASTVSRVLADDPRITAATKEMARSVAERLHYITYPTPLLAVFRNQATTTLGFLIEDLVIPCADR
jgi:DNA-binding LacI/PurR family transcriptional regulator